MHTWPPRRQSLHTSPPMDHTTSDALLPEVGSFSYSWPTSKPKPQPEERRISQGDIAADPASASQCSFDFRLSVSDEQTEAMAVADQMFHDGLLLPLHLASQHGQEQEDGHTGRKQPALTRSLSLDSSQRMIASASAATTSKRHAPAPRSVSQNSSPFNVRGGTVTAASARGAVVRMSKIRLPSFGRCRTKQHRWMSFRFLVPLYRKMVRCVWSGKAAEEKAMDAPRRARGAKAKLCDLGQESAIRDAILHCKR